MPQLTPYNVASWPRHEVVKHRAAILLRIEAFLANGYWQDLSMSEEVKTLILEDWADELQNWSMDRIRAALIAWRDENPRRRPNPGDIKKILKDEWGRENAAKVRAAMSQPDDHAGMSREDHQRVSAEMSDKLAAFIRPMPKVAE